MRKKTLVMTFLAAAAPFAARAADPSAPGAGNAAAARTGESSALVREAGRYLREQARSIRDPHLRQQTLDALEPSSCVHHRIGVGPTERKAILDRLLAEGLLTLEDLSFSAGVQNGLFPPLLDEASACPRQPQSFVAAPGGGFHGHHSYPGGLAVHVAMNTRIASSLAADYAVNYDFPSTRADADGGLDRVARDAAVAGALWHDWAKPMVFQWNADGSEFSQLSLAGNGVTDAWGSAGNSRTGSHHILSLAEAMARHLRPEVVITQACAQNTPTEGAEYIAVNWLRAAAVVARVDPVAEGYLSRDKLGRLRLPALARLGEVDLLAAGQLNLMHAYVIGTMSDSDWTYSEPALAIAEVLLEKLAPRFGHDPAATARYNVGYRNVVLSQLGCVRIHALYQARGLAAVEREIEQLHRRGLL